MDDKDVSEWFLEPSENEFLSMKGIDEYVQNDGQLSENSDEQLEDDDESIENNVNNNIARCNEKSDQKFVSLDEQSRAQNFLNQKCMFRYSVMENASRLANFGHEHFISAVGNENMQSLKVSVKISRLITTNIDGDNNNGNALSWNAQIERIILQLINNPSIQSKSLNIFALTSNDASFISEYEIPIYNNDTVDLLSSQEKCFPYITPESFAMYFAMAFLPVERHLIHCDNPYILRINVNMMQSVIRNPNYSKNIARWTNRQQNTDHFDYCKTKYMLVFNNGIGKWSSPIRIRTRTSFYDLYKLLSYHNLINNFNIPVQVIEKLQTMSINFTHFDNQNFAFNINCIKQILLSSYTNELLDNIEIDSLLTSISYCHLISCMKSMDWCGIFTKNDDPHLHKSIKMSLLKDKSYLDSFVSGTIFPSIVSMENVDTLPCSVEIMSRMVQWQKHSKNIINILEMVNKDANNAWFPVQQRILFSDAAYEIMTRYHVESFSLDKMSFIPFIPSSNSGSISDTVKTCNLLNIGSDSFICQVKSNGMKMISKNVDCRFGIDQFRLIVETIDHPQRRLESFLHNLKNETRILSLLPEHSNIIKYLGWSFNGACLSIYQEVMDMTFSEYLEFASFYISIIPKIKDLARDLVSQHAKTKNKDLFSKFCNVMANNNDKLLCIWLKKFYNEKIHGNWSEYEQWIKLMHVKLCRVLFARMANDTLPNALMKLNIDLMINAYDGVIHLHKNKIVHRDLKYQNLMIKIYPNDNILLKIIDFQYACPMSATIMTPVKGNAANQPRNFKTPNNFFNYSDGSCDIYALNTMFGYVCMVNSIIADDDRQIDLNNDFLNFDAALKSDSELIANKIMIPKSVAKDLDWFNHRLTECPGTSMNILELMYGVIMTFIDDTSRIEFRRSVIELAAQLSDNPENHGAQCPYTVLFYNIIVKNSAGSIPLPPYLWILKSSCFIKDREQKSNIANINIFHWKSLVSKLRDSKLRDSISRL